MKKIFNPIAILAFMVISLVGFGQPRKYVVDYDAHFTGERLRLDLIFAGNSTKQEIFLAGMKKEDTWAGSKQNLIDYFGYGEYFFEVYSGKEIIYSKGFCTLFQEWRTTAEAAKVSKAFTNSVWMPFPKETVKVVFYDRVKKTGKFSELFSFSIDPTDKMINCEKENNYKVSSIQLSGEPENKVDILFIAEGYTAKEMKKFLKDCRKFTEYLFSMEPYKGRRDDFNIWAVESISQESGTDIPNKDIWKNTIALSNFYTFYTDRYLTAPDQTAIASLASNAPFDALFVVVNEEKYGGGGIYNFYGLGTSDHRLSNEVFIHEFGHSFAGLGDEYYDSSTAYEDFYNLAVEPWEPNITTLVNFGAKWKDLILPSTPQPTPNDSTYLDVVGLFEGGGYMTKGIYRPYLDCRMKTNTAKGFCPACQRAINAMIDFYCK